MICVGVRRAECAVVWAFQRMAAYARFLQRLRIPSEGPESANTAFRCERDIGKAAVSWKNSMVSFVRTADLYAKCIEWQVSALLCRNVYGAAFVTLGFSCVHCDWYQCPH